MRCGHVRDSTSAAHNLLAHPVSYTPSRSAQALQVTACRSFILCNDCPHTLKEMEAGICTHVPRVTSGASCSGAVMTRATPTSVILAQRPVISTFCAFMSPCVT